MLEDLLEWIPKMFIPIGAAFGFLSWLWPGVPRLARRKLNKALGVKARITGKKTPAFWITLAAFVAILFLYGSSEWGKIQSSKKVPRLELKADSTNLAQDLLVFAMDFAGMESGLRDYELGKRYEQIEEVQKRLRLAGKSSSKLNVLVGTTHTSLNMDSNWLFSAGTEIGNLARGL